MKITNVVCVNDRDKQINVIVNKSANVCKRRERERKMRVAYGAVCVSQNEAVVQVNERVIRAKKRNRIIP